MREWKMATLVINAGQTLNDLNFVGNPTHINAPLQMLGGGEASMSFVFTINEEGPDTITGILSLDDSFVLPTPPISFMPPTGTHSENHVYNMSGPGDFTIVDPVSGDPIGTVTGAPYSFTLFVTTMYDASTGETSWTYGTTVPGNPWFGFWTQNDTVTLDAGDDRFVDNTGKLTLDAGDGNDEIYAYGDDPVTAADADHVMGGEGDDELRFQYGGHTIDGGAGNDVIGGSGGTHQGELVSTLIGGTGNDVVYGSYTADRFVEGDASGNDTYVGGTGSDTMDYSAITTGGVTVDLSVGFDLQDTGAAGTDIIVEIDNVVGTAQGDTIRGQGGANRLEGGGGDDTIHASGGTDFLDGGAGTDTAVFTGVPGQYTVSTNAENQLVMTSFFGTTTLTGFEWVQVGTETYDFAVLLAGAPVITSGGGGETATAELNENSLEVTTVTAVDPNSDTLSFSIIGGDDGGFFEIDEVTGALRFKSFEYYPAPNFEDPRDTDHDNVYHVTVQVSDGNGHFDTQDIAVTVSDLQHVSITGTSLNDVIDATHTVPGESFPSNEDDFIAGLEGDDVIASLEGNDTLVGGDGVDSLDGGAGEDRLDFSGEGGSNGVIVNLSGNSFDTGNGDPVTIAAHSAQDTFGNVDAITDIEGARGTELNDVFIGTDQVSNFEGLGGDDILIGGSRDDFFNPGAGNDFADGAGPNDADVIHYYEEDSAIPQQHGIVAVLNGDNSGTIIDPWGDIDSFINIESIRGTDFADSFTGADGRDRFIGAGGADSFDGGSNFDELDFFHENNVQTHTHGIIANLSDEALGPIEIENLSVAGIGAGVIIDTYGETDTVVSIEGITGTIRGDFMAGSDADNFFQGEVGDDVLIGNGGNDELIGDAGADILDGGEGNDQVNYRAEAAPYKHLPGAHGVIVNLSTQTLEDVSVAGIATTDVAAGTAIDTHGQIDQLSSIERINGTDDDDLMVGSDGRDELHGRGGNDELRGGRGEDQLQGGAGNDLLIGGGADDFDADFFTGGRGNDTIIGGENADEYNRVQYNGETEWGDDDPGTHGVIVNLSDAVLQGVSVTGIATTDVAAGTAIDSYGDTDTLINIQNADGTEFDDILVGDDTRNDLNGRAGNDQLFGGLDEDQLKGGAGDDLLVGGGADDFSADFFVGGRGNDTIIGGENANEYNRVQYAGETEWEDDDQGEHGVIVNLSSEALVGVSVTGIATTDVAAGTAIDSYGDLDTLVNIQNADGTQYDDILVGGDEDNDFDGRGGDDIIIGGNGNNHMVGGDGNDTITGGDRDDFVDGGRGDDVAYGGGNGENEYDNLEYRDAEDGVHVIKTSRTDGTVDGAWAGHDVFDGFEIVVGSNHADLFDGSAEDDDFTGNGGDDVFNGGAGSDRIVYDKEQYANGGEDTHGVIVNLSDAAISADVGQGTIVVAAGTAIDGFGDTDTLDSIEQIVGTNHDDHIVGNGDDNYMEGRNGNDVLVGGDGRDSLNGDDGDDTLDGGEGGDNLSGWYGDDIISGGAGGDYINAGFGTDTAEGGAGSDDDGNTWDTLGFSWGQAINPGDGLTVSFTGADGAGTATGSFADGHNDEGEPNWGTVNTSFSGFEHVEGSSGDDSFTVAAGYVATSEAARVWADGRGTGMVDVSGGAGNDSFVDLVDPTGTAGGSIIVSYDGDKWGTGDFDGHTWGTEAGEHGVVVNLSGATQTATDFDLNNGGPTVDIEVGAQQSFDLFGDTDSFAGVQAVWLTDADDWFWGDDTLDSFVGGAAGDDHLFGGAGDDLFFGGTGADIIVGGAGHDTVRYDWHGDAPMGILVNLTTSPFTFPGMYNVGAGQIRDLDGSLDSVSEIEEIIGSNLNDYMVVGNQGMVLHGGGGNDTLSAGSGVDRIYGGDGDDWIGGGNHFIGDGANYLDGGEGSDTIGGAGGADEMHGGGGQDQMVGRQGDDVMHGGTHQDNLYGSVGNDELYGDDGDDLLVGSSGDDLIDGGTGDAFGGVDGIDDDLVDYSLEASNEDAGGPLATGEGVIVNMSDEAVTVGSHTVAAGHARDVFGGDDTLTEIENVRGTNLADTLIGDGENNDLHGLGGDDTLIGGDGADLLDGSSGSDALTGGSGNDTLIGGGGEGEDTAYYFGDRTDYEVVAHPGGSFTITDLRAGPNDGVDQVSGVEHFAFADGTFSAAQLLNAPVTAPADSDSAANQIDENASIGSEVGITAAASDPNSGDTVTYSLSSNPGGLFAIDAETGVVTTAAAIDFESSGGSIEIEVTATSSDGSSEATSFEVAIGDVDEAPEASDATVSVAEDGTYTFAAEDFPFTDPDQGGGSGLVSVTIYAPPGAGTLNFDGVALDAGAIGAGFTVSAADLVAGKLTFTPAADANGDDYASFSYAVSTASQFGLVAAWSFEGSGEDISAGDNDVALFGGATYGDGLRGQGLELDGAVGSYAQEIGSSSEFDLGNEDFSVVAWFRLDGATGREQTLIEDFFSGGGPGWTWTMPGASELRLHADGAVVANLPASNLEDGNWHQAVVTRSGDTFSLYLDGVLGTTYTATGAITSSAGPLLIGTRNAADGRNFTLDGAIDDVAVWSRSLSAAEIAAQWNDGEGVDIAGTGAPILSAPATMTIDVTPVNDAPVISSNGGGETAAVSRAENGVAVTTVVAADIDGPGVSYAITGGADAARFTIDATTGVLSFVAAPDFEAPTDADGNNVYEVVVSASDGSLSDTQNIAVTVTDLNGVVINGTGSADTIDATHTPAGQPLPTDEADTIYGNGGNDVISGLGGDDLIDGAIGSDTMRGGTGNDTYIVGASTDQVIENAGEGTDLVRSSVTYTLSAEVENLTLTGASSINGTGNALNNVLTGNGANNTLNGGLGADQLIGGLGNDIYVVDNAGDSVVELIGEGTDLVQASVSYGLGDEVENLTLTGSANIDGTGNGLNNLITGNTGSNLLNGGGGLDTLVGGLGNDTYVIDEAADIVTEAANAGTDTVLFEGSGDYTLGGNVENLILGADAANGTGNALANAITGNAEANVLNGGAGADTLTGAAGDDTYVVDNAGDQAIEQADGGTDQVNASISYTLGAELENLTLVGTSAINGTGNALGNVITGNSAANILNGGAGADLLVGGGGNDTYVVDDAGDVIDESVNGGAGTDTVQSSISFDLGAAQVLGDVERLTLTGTANIEGTGNGLNNVITGNSGDNLLDGGGGVDSLAGGLGNDTYVTDGGDTITEAAAAGTDTVRSSVDYTLGANLENLVLLGAALAGTGNSLDNTITGNAEANLLSGGAGIDTLIGGVGDDIYIVDNAADVATELAGEGIDEVRSSVSYSLGGEVENLTLTGSSAINGTGNGLANLITGNGASNMLSGGAGNDTLNGGAGADNLSGGEGDDSFIVDNLGDVVNELAGEGSDLVLASVSHTLGAEVENLTLTGTGASNGTGNSLNNLIIGNSGANVLNGLEGADQMSGGAGNDTYVVDNAGDIVDEASHDGAGIDTVQSSISFSLADSAHVLGEVERLTLTGTANLNGTGNAADNLITGNSGSNVLDGGAGTDTLVGGLGNDTYIADIVGDVVTEAASAGTDTVIFNGAAGTFVLGANVENLTLGGSAAIGGTGNGLANVLLGNGAGNTLSGGLGNDTLNGGAGADTLIGGGGNDTYVVDNAGDSVDEVTGGGGIDTVQSSVSFSLLADGAHVLGVVENLILTGTASVSGTGNALDNLIGGNAGGNILFGAAGDDTLSGNGGADTLIGGTGHDDLFGGAGADVFDFNVADFGGAGGAMADHSDEIFDFSSADGDSIDLSGLLNDAMALVGGDANSLLRASMVGNDLVIEVNESAVLDGSAVQSNWGEAITVRDVGDPEAVSVVFANQTWHYDADTNLFGL